MRRRRAFTLIELLVVIAILVVLMGLLFPVLRRAREAARAVVCQGRLRQVGTVFALFVESNDGWLPDLAHQPSGMSAWHLATQPPWSDHPELLLCPSAAKPSPGARDWWSDTFHAYSYVCGNPNRHSSYGFNYYVHRREIPNDHEGRLTPGTWLKAAVRQAPHVPVLFDALCAIAAPHFADLRPPDQEGHVPNLAMSDVCINRHNGGTNMVFMDWSVRKVELKQLWTLKWNSQFDIANSWTKAGGMKPEDWPEWLRPFKDY
jgi:prepilin-type N-terminal cleavage/methylation domain-containing protein/prepilin-type processing-associated H-X9-DG protein